MYAVIKQIFDGIPELVTDSYYGRKILSAYNAYGSGYDFCKFYSCGEGIIHTYNTSMVINGDVDICETELFINMTKPTSIEVKNEIPLQLDDPYVCKHRTLFYLKPRKTDVSIDDVNVNSFTERCFEILSKSFDDLTDYSAWYVDISHKIRHNVSELYLYGSTTVTRQFNINGFIFLSHIATAPEERGKGTARRLLYCLGNEAERQGENAYLFALDHRRSFYETIGFEPVYEDILYEMKG